MKPTPTVISAVKKPISPKMLRASLICLFILFSAGSAVLCLEDTPGELEQMLVMANEDAGTSDDEETKSSSETKYATGNVKLIDDPKRPTATDLCRALDKSFSLVDLKVVDDSAAHEGDAGALEMGLTSDSAAF